VRLRYLVPLASLLAVAPVLTACDDDGFLQDALILPDTVLVGLPGDPARGSALDLVRASANATLVRRPERLQDAEQWDVALRRVEGGLVLRPHDALGSGGRGAGVGVASRDYDAIEEAPRGTASYSEDDVPLTANGVYFIRSRQFADAFGFVCVKYAKAKVLELDVEAGQMRMALTVNDNCDDERLTDD